MPKDEIGQVGREWLTTILSRFGPVKEKAANTTTLEFEKPLLELDKRIKEVGPDCHGGQNGVVCKAALFRNAHRQDPANRTGLKGISQL